MDQTQAKPKRKRRWLIVAFVIGILLVMLAGGAWRKGKSIIDSVSFCDFLVRHPNVVPVVRPLFDFSGYGPSFQHGYTQARIRVLVAELEPGARRRPSQRRSPRNASQD